MVRHLALLVVGLLLLAACATPQVAEQRPAGPAATPSAAAEPTRLSIAVPISPTPEREAQPGDPVPPEIIATAEALFGEGGIYVAHLLRPTDVPAGWLLDRAPRYASRLPEPGETYSFACEELPARSIGVAGVGYRSLEGLPSLSVEYVIYPSADAAKAALADMQGASERCGDFRVEVAGGVDARITPIPFASLGEASFAAALETSSDGTGDLLTHVVKVQQGRVVIGINHAVLAGEAEPDRALTEAMARLAAGYVAMIE